MRVDFKNPKGEKHHAVLVDPDDMTHGSKMRVQELLNLYQDDAVHPFNAGSRILEKLIAEVVKDWSIDFPVPHGDVTALAEVPDWAYDPLVEGVEEHRDRLDFNRIRSTSSASRTPSEDTSSQDKNPQTAP
jgi:hypothetical protein